MAGIFETLLTDAKTIPLTGHTAPLMGTLRTVYDELAKFADEHDKAIPTAYAESDQIVEIPANSESAVSGNFTISVEVPSLHKTFTTANLAYNANAATIQTALDTAMADAGDYEAGDIAVTSDGSLETNNVTLTGTANDYVGRSFIVTTANVNLGTDSLVAPEVTTIGQPDRPWLAAMVALNIIGPTGDPTISCAAPTIDEWQALTTTALGDVGNPFSVSPTTVRALVDECVVSEGREEYRQVFGQLIKSLG
jgi:hypothetical protein